MVENAINQVENARNVRCLGHTFGIDEGNGGPPSTTVNRISRKQHGMVYDRGAFDLSSCSRNSTKCEEWDRSSSISAVTETIPRDVFREPSVEKRRHTMLSYFSAHLKSQDNVLQGKCDEFLLGSYQFDRSPIGRP